MMATTSQSAMAKAMPRMVPSKRAMLQVKVVLWSMAMLATVVEVTPCFYQ